LSTQQRRPDTLAQLILLVVKGFVTGLPQIIKGMLVMVVISTVVANAVHLYLMGWVNDGWNSGGNPILDALIFIDGQQGSPRVMLFYFAASYIFWWIIGMIRSRGLGTTLKLVLTTPLWVGGSLARAGAGSFPALMAGLAASFALGLTLLTEPTSLMMLLTSATVLVSQAESIMVFALQLGIRDASRLVNRARPSALPDKSAPVVGVLGSALGFAYMTFFDPAPLTLLAFTLLTAAGLVYLALRGRNGRRGAAVAAFILVAAAACLAPTAMADDGGIRENGGWSSLATYPWLLNTLITRGYPASGAAILGSLLISMLFNPRTLSTVKPLDDGYVDKDWSGITRGGVVDAPTEFAEDPHGAWTTPDGRRWTPTGQEGTGLRRTIIDAEDNPALGNRVRVYTMEPPKDQALLEGISRDIAGLDRWTVDRLHPDNWKDLTPGQRGVVMQQLNTVIKDRLGVEYNFTVVNDPDKGLGGSFDPTTKTIEVNANGNAFDDPRTAIRTLIHEARHAYQDRMQDPSGTDYQRMCNYNNGNYTGSNDDYVRYAEQFIERDSRTFGNNAANQTINELNQVWAGR
jgi:hypothetical protein